MLIGRSCQPASARAASHSSSPHSNRDVVTTEALAGGTSVAYAIGSLLTRQCPSAPSTWNR
jgi:hypothetical protein